MKIKSACILCILVILTVSCSAGEQILFTKPEQPPALYIMRGEREYSTVLGSYRWTAEEEIKRVQEIWPPPLPGIPAPVEQGEEVTFFLKGNYGKPDSGQIKLYIEDYFRYPSPDQQGELASITLGEDHFTKKEEGVEGVFAFPRLEEQQKGRKLVAKVELLWGKEDQVSDQATYYAVFQEVDQRWVEEIEAVITGFSEAAWKGSRERAAYYLSDAALQRINNSNRPSLYSFASIDELAGWRYLLWDDPVKQFKRLGEPQLDIIALWPSNGLYRAEAVYKYQVEVTEGDNKNLWHFEEYYNLERGEGNWESGWKINMFRRNGKPFGQETGEVGWKVSVDREGNMLKIGPFTDVNLHRSLWSPGGYYMAFIGENFDARELWLGEMTSGKFSRVFRLDPAEYPGNNMYSDITILNVEDSGEVVFMVHGYVNKGSYRGQQGLWVMVRKPGNSKPSTLAFVPAAKADYIRWYKLIEGGKYLLVNTGNLLRVDLEEGTSKVLRSDMPDYLVPVMSNHKGTLMAWEIWDDEGIKVLVYDPIEEREVILESPGKELRVDFQGVFGDFVAVSLCKQELIQGGIDGDWPVGIERILLYDLHGQVKGEIIPPTGQYLKLLGYDINSRELYYAAGYVKRKMDNPEFESYMYLHSTGIYKQLVDGNTSQLIAQAEGRIASMEHSPDGKVFWFIKSSQEGGRMDVGLLLSREGTIKKVHRYYGEDSIRGYFLLQSGSKGYIRVFDPGERIGYLKEVDQDGERILISGKFYIDQFSALKNRMVFVTEPGNMQPHPQKVYMYMLRVN